MVGHWAGFFGHLLAAIFFGVTGLMLVMRPLISAEALTFVMAIFFLIGGLFELIGSLLSPSPAGAGRRRTGSSPLSLARWSLRSGPPQDSG